MMGALFLAMVWYATRWKAAVDELRRASERERDFVRDASHQLRTPITVARGHVELLHTQLHNPLARQDLDVVLGELDRLALISDRLLTIATAERSRLVARGEVNIGRVVSGAVRRWRSAAARRWSVSVRAHGRLLGDEERIVAALDALIENAVKATDPGDQIAIELRTDGEFAVVEVADTGIGLAPEDVDRVFDRFWRASPSSGRVSRGTGLGLAMVKAIAEAHGGSAEAEARDGGGAIFRIRLRGLVPLLWTAGPGGREPAVGSGLRDGSTEMPDAV